MVAESLSSYDQKQLECELSELASLAANESTRHKFNGKSQLVYDIVNNLQNGSSSVQFQCLRVLGNMCADNNANRDLIIREEVFLQALKSSLTAAGGENDNIRNTSIIVAFNFCNDYEPAQRCLIDNGFVTVLFYLLDKLHQNDISDFILRILEMLLLNEAMSESILPPSALHTLIQSIGLASIGEYSILITKVLSFKSFQSMALENDQCDLRKLCSLYENFAQSLEAEDATEILADLVLALANISCLDEFPDKVSLDNELVPVWRSWILNRGSGSGISSLRTAGLTALGNLATNEAACIKVVHDLQLHTDIICAVNIMTSAQEFHAAGGFLKNLAISEKNKRQLVEENAFTVVRKLISKDMPPQVIFSGLSVLRQLVNNSYENAYDLAKSNPHDGILSRCLEIGKKNEEKNLKIETGRILCALIRATARLACTDELLSLLTEAFSNDIQQVKLLFEIILQLLLDQGQEPTFIPGTVYAVSLFAHDNETKTFLVNLLDDRDDLTDRLRQLIENPQVSREVIMSINAIFMVLGNKISELPDERPLSRLVAEIDSEIARRQSVHTVV
ncbi:armadillo-type protein [Lipomyces chichibuensis]|uniref:armadillo-type protein n=1 Tax=Lipomyces chichibuensis TaxID=1546026 RepID=UPI0033430666